MRRATALLGILILGALEGRVVAQTEPPRACVPGGLAQKLKELERKLEAETASPPRLANERELAEMKSTKVQLSALDSPPRFAVAKETRTDLYAFVAHSESPIVAVIGHNEHGVLRLLGGGRARVAELEKTCAKHRKICVIISCESERHLSGAAAGITDAAEFHSILSGVLQSTDSHTLADVKAAVRAAEQDLAKKHRISVKTVAVIGGAVVVVVLLASDSGDDDGKDRAVAGSAP